MTEHITGVALLAEDGRMWALTEPARHGTLFALTAFQGEDAEPCTQGFVTSEGRFVNRIQALHLATESGQRMRNLGAHTQLYSEDLW